MVWRLSPEANLRLQSHLLAGCLAFALTIGLVAGGSMALCGIGGAIALYALETLRQKRLVPLQPVAWIFGSVFLLLVMLGNITALAPERSWPMSGRLFTIVLPLMLFFHQRPAPLMLPAWLPRYLPWGCLFCLLLVLLDMLTGGAVLLSIIKGKHERLIYYNRGLSYAAVLIWPLVVLLLHQGRRILAVLLPLLLLVVGGLSESRGAPLALLFGAGFGALAWMAPWLARLTAAGLLAVVFCLTLAVVAWFWPALPDGLEHLPPSWRHRVEIWHYLLGWLGQRPWPPAGVDAAGVIAPLTSFAGIYKYALAPAAHPHHMPLQLLLELGFVGWLWGVSLASWALARLRNRSGFWRAGALASWAALLTLTCGAFSLWSDSFWATGSLALVFGQNMAAWLRKSDDPSV